MKSRWLLVIVSYALGALTIYLVNSAISKKAVREEIGFSLAADALLLEKLQAGKAVDAKSDLQRLLVGELLTIQESSDLRKAVRNEGKLRRVAIKCLELLDAGEMDLSDLSRINKLRELIDEK